MVRYACAIARILSDFEGTKNKTRNRICNCKKKDQSYSEPFVGCPVADSEKRFAYNTTVTPTYAAPEQLTGVCYPKIHDSRSIIFLPFDSFKRYFKGYLGFNHRLRNFTCINIPFEEKLTNKVNRCKFIFSLSLDIRLTNYSVWALFWLDCCYHFKPIWSEVRSPNRNKTKCAESENSHNNSVIRPLLNNKIY